MKESSALVSLNDNEVQEILWILAEFRTFPISLIYFNFTS